MAQNGDNYNNNNNVNNDTRKDPNSGGSSLQGSSTGPSASAANVGSGHRPALNEWKFPSTPRVATPAPFEPQPQQQQQQQDSLPTGASSPAINQMAQFQQQQQPLDYFNQPTSSYALSAQQQLQQQHLQHQQQQQQQHLQHQQNSQPFSINLGGGGGQFRDGAHTPRSPYSLIGSKDNIHGEPPSQDALLQLQNGLLQAQSLQRSSHSHSQSQDSIGTATELSGMLHHMPAYHYQLQHDVAQPGHSLPPPPPPPPHDLQLLQEQQQQGLSLMPHQLQTPSEFALKMLFTQFVKMAEAKLNAMVQIPLVRSFFFFLFVNTRCIHLTRNILKHLETRIGNK